MKAFENTFHSNKKINQPDFKTPRISKKDLIEKPNTKFK